MLIFLTGATGFVGSHVVPELLGAGHRVLGLTRSDAGARSLEAAGAEPHRGDLEDLDSIRRGAARADGVIHCAFDHAMENFAANCAKDRRVIEAIGDALVGSDRPLVITSGTGLGGGVPGRPATEDRFDRDHATPRIASELGGLAVAARGVNVSVVRLPQVHDRVKQGLITMYVELSRAKGRAAYVGDGANRFSAAHVLDVARLYRLAFERREANSRYHAVAEEGVPMRQIAETVGRGLNVPAVSLTPAEAAEHFGWFAMFADMDLVASSALTRATLGWQPTGPTLIEDLEHMKY